MHANYLLCVIKYRHAQVFDNQNNNVGLKDLCFAGLLGSKNLRSNLRDSKLQFSEYHGVNITDEYPVEASSTLNHIFALEEKVEKECL